MKTPDFVFRVLKLIADNDFYDYIHFSVKDDEILFYVICNDLFFWACSDAEGLDESNIDLLDKTIKEINNLKSEEPGFQYDAPILFCCRSRKMRPQKKYYKYISKETHHLFDACGEERTS